MIFQIEHQFFVCETAWCQRLNQRNGHIPLASTHTRAHSAVYKREVYLKVVHVYLNSLKFMSSRQRSQPVR